MKSIFKVTILIAVAVVIMSCSSTLHLYSGQQYFSDEELGTLTVSEQIQIFKFDRKLVQRTPKPPVIKALPGEHRVEYILGEADDSVSRTIFWDAVEGRIYELVLNGDNDVTILDVTDN